MEIRGWIELVDSSPFIRASDVAKMLEGLMFKTGCEADPLILDEAETNFISYRAIFVDIPPDLAEVLVPLSEVLHAEEYLVFEEKVRFGHREDTLRVIVVSGTGVYSVDSKKIKNEAMKLAGLL